MVGMGMQMTTNKYRTKSVMYTMIMLALIAMSVEATQDSNSLSNSENLNVYNVVPNSDDPNDNTFLRYPRSIEIINDT